MISKIKDMDSLKELFEGWEETIIWSCLQGIMGEANADLVKYRLLRCGTGLDEFPSAF